VSDICLIESKFIEPLFMKRDVDEVVWPMRKRHMVSWPIERKRQLKECKTKKLFRCTRR
jgi:hypothetical protein